VVLAQPIPERTQLPRGRRIAGEFRHDGGADQQIIEDTLKRGYEDVVVIGHDPADAGWCEVVAPV
jgi:hypothetical protein